MTTEVKTSRLREELVGHIRDERALFVVGTGVSLNATRNEQPTASWGGLILDGLNYCAELDPMLPPEWAAGKAKELEAALRRNALEELIAIATIVEQKLGGMDRRKPDWAQWLRRTVGRLKVVDHVLVDALRNIARHRLATCNYDDVLTSTDCPPFPWTNTSECQLVLSGQQTGVVHLHGHWRTHESVVLGYVAYSDVFKARGAQALQQTMATLSSLVFVGFGAGLDDPNIGHLMKWMSETFPEKQDHHFRLVRSDDVKRLYKPDATDRLVLLDYGPTHDSLLGYIQRLTEDAGIAAAPSRPIRVAREAELRRSTVPGTAGEADFVGRANSLQAIADGLAARSTSIIHGPPGVGKSRLSKQYALMYKDRYPGGTFFVDFDERPIPPTDLATLVRVLGAEEYANESFDDRCKRGLSLVGQSEPALLIFDGVPNPDTLKAWLPPQGLNVHLLVTSTFAYWLGNWHTVQLLPFTETESQSLVASILGDRGVVAKYAPALIERAGGLAMELCASAGAVAEKALQGRAAEIDVDLGDETTSSYLAAWSLLSADGQLLLRAACSFAVRRPPLDLIGIALRLLGWSDEMIERAVDAVRARWLASGTGEQLETHQLVVRFVRAQGESGKDLREALFTVLKDIAREVQGRPGDVEFRAKLVAHEISINSWREVASDWHIVGSALRRTGFFREARSWFEEALVNAKRANALGQVDHGRVGSRLHEIGECLWLQGEFGDARRHFEQAVEEKKLGNEDGVVNHASLGGSLNQIGWCLWQGERFADALTWFEQAIAHSEQGDLEHRVDHESLGNSMSMIGASLLDQGRRAEARSWLERSVAQKQLGDVHGRINHASLGNSLHMFGMCLFRQGETASARPLFEEATKEHAKGDTSGRVDHSSIGNSVHMIGCCVPIQTNRDEAREYFERAVKEKMLGDVFGRIDPGSIGLSQQAVGECFMQEAKFDKAKFADARRWLEDALQHQERGDEHGRIDRETLWGSLHGLGECLWRQRLYVEAQDRFEEAARHAGIADSLGRVDHDKVSRSQAKVGACLRSQDRIEAAREWFEKSAREAEHGNIDGDVNHENIGRSEYDVGGCVAHDGLFLEATEWFNSAKEHAEKGDLHGNVNWDGIGNIVHMNGWCLLNLDRVDEARAWSIDAVEAKRRGDVSGRIDHESIGRSQDQVGDCVLRAESASAALEWYKAAVAEKRRGDRHGVIDEASIDLSRQKVSRCLAEMVNQ